MFNNKILKNKITINSSLQFTERILNLIFMFISSLFVIRYFTPNDYGIISYANSYISLFSILTNLGINTIVVREIIKNPKTENIIIGSSFIITLTGSIISSLIITLSSLIHNNPTITIVLILFCITITINSLSIINNYFQAHTKTNYLAFAMIIQDIFDFTSKLLLIKYKCTIVIFAAQSIFSSIILYMILYYFYFKLTLIKWKFDLNICKHILKQSLPLALSGVIINIYMRIDQVMLMHYSGLTEVAEYNVSIKLLELFYIFPMILIPNIFPILIKNFEISKQKFNTIFISLLRYAIIIGIIINLFLFISSNYIVTLLYGDKYNNAGYFLQYLSFCIIPVFIGLISSLWLQINNLQNKQFYQTSIGLVVCLLFNYILIPKYAGYGAIISLILAHTFNAIISPIFFSDLRPLFYYYLKIFIGNKNE